MVQQSESRGIEKLYRKAVYLFILKQNKKKKKAHKNPRTPKKKRVPWYSALPATGVVLKRLPDIHRMPRRSCSRNGEKLTDE